MQPNIGIVFCPIPTISKKLYGSSVGILEGYLSKELDTRIHINGKNEIFWSNLNIVEYYIYLTLDLSNNRH